MRVCVCACVCVCVCVYAHSCLTLWLRGLYPSRLLCPWNFPGKNTGTGSISSPRGSSLSRDRTRVSYVSCVGSLPLCHLGSPAGRESLLSSGSCNPMRRQTCVQKPMLKFLLNHEKFFKGELFREGVRVCLHYLHCVQTFLWLVGGEVAGVLCSAWSYRPLLGWETERIWAWEDPTGSCSISLAIQPITGLSAKDKIWCVFVIEM